MDYIVGIGLLACGALFLVFGVKLFFHDKNEFEYNHNLSGGLANAIVGDIGEKNCCPSDEISRGFTIDVRNGELVPCSQLSREVIK